jgi:hypothetical protein
VDPDPDLDPDPAIFVTNLQDANKKLIKKKSFSAYYFLKVDLHHFSKIKSQKEDAKQQESKFFLLFLLDDRRIRSPFRSRAESGARSGSIPPTSGSGSGSRRPKNIWIWIRNTAFILLSCSVVIPDPRGYALTLVVKNDPQK